MSSNQPPRSAAATFHYDRPVPQEEQRRIVINLYESGIAEEFIALQLDLEIPVVIRILKESNIYRGNFE
jgi:DNA invertase Pin-like site-specific DNA recombinase